MTQLIEVRRIPVIAPFDYPAAKAEHDDAQRRGDVISTEGQDIVIRTKVFIRSAAA